MYSTETANPLISIVIPTYKRAVFLERAIDSVLTQTYPRWELIVVDDNGEGSDHQRETEAFMARYVHVSAVRYLKHASNRGGSAARNTGIRHSDGAYVAFLDDDDEWLPTKLAQQISCFERASDRVGIVYTGTKVIDDETGTSHLEIPHARGRVFPQILGRNDIGTTSSFLCKRDVLFEAGMFDEGLKASQDYDLCVRLARICEFAYVGEPLVVRHKHQEMRITKALENKIAASERMYEKYAAVYEQERGVRGQFLFRQGKGYMAAGKRKQAIGKFWGSFRADPRKVKRLGHLFVAAAGPAAYRVARHATRPLRKAVGRAKSAER